MSSPSFEPVERAQLPDQVIESIKNYIEKNGLLHGAKLPGERDLARELGVSRNVTREALRVLQATGILDIQPGNGIFVAEFGFEALANHFSFVIRCQKHQMQYLIEARLLLETSILKLAAKRMQPHDAEKLEQIARSMLITRTIEEDVKAEIEFHSYLVHITGNPVLMEFSGIFNRFFSEAQQLKGDWFQESESRLADANEHLDIIQALKHQDVERAQHILESSMRRWELGMEGVPG